MSTRLPLPLRGALGVFAGAAGLALAAWLHRDAPGPLPRTLGPEGASLLGVAVLPALLFVMALGLVAATRRHGLPGALLLAGTPLAPGLVTDATAGPATLGLLALAAAGIPGRRGLLVAGILLLAATLLAPPMVAVLPLIALDRGTARGRRLAPLFGFLALGAVLLATGPLGHDALRNLGWLTGPAAAPRPALGVLFGTLAIAGLLLQGAPSPGRRLLTAALGMAAAAGLATVPEFRDAARALGLAALGAGLLPLAGSAPAPTPARGRLGRGVLATASLAAILSSTIHGTAARLEDEGPLRRDTARLVAGLRAARAEAPLVGGIPRAHPLRPVLDDLEVPSAHDLAPFAREVGSPVRLWWWSDAVTLPGGLTRPSAFVRLVDAHVAPPGRLRLEAPAERPTVQSGVRDEPRFAWSVPEEADPGAEAFRFVALGWPTGSSRPHFHEVSLHEGVVRRRVAAGRAHYAWRPSWRSRRGAIVEREIVWGRGELTAPGTTLHWSILALDPSREPAVVVAAGRDLPVLADGPRAAVEEPSRDGADRH